MTQFSFNNVLQQENDILHRHLQVSFNLTGTQVTHIFQHTHSTSRRTVHPTGSPRYHGDTARMMLVWVYLYRIATHLRIAMQIETRTSKDRITSLDTSLCIKFHTPISTRPSAVMVG